MEGLRIFVNDRWIEPVTGSGSPVLDFIRGELGLTGTKEGCREGDCGACAILVGEDVPGAGLRYRALPSCLLATGDLDGKHLITIEGLSGAGYPGPVGGGSSAPDGLTPVMRAFLEENASQCGFFSPGFILALSCWLSRPGVPDIAGAMKAVDGNLCRCTGYGAIRRAAERLVKEFSGLPGQAAARLGVLVERGVLPRSVLAYMEETGREAGAKKPQKAPKAPTDVFLGGGTDFFVRNPDPDRDFSPTLLRSIPGLAGIEPVSLKGKSWVRIGAATVMSDFFASPLLRKAVPGIGNFEEEFASSLIRDLATLGGNIANASPVGDLTSMLMGMGAVLELGLADPGIEDPRIFDPRLLPIEKFFKGYKKTALGKSELIAAILIPRGTEAATGQGNSDMESSLRFSFEKISKRKHLDIAAVNTAMSFRIGGGRFRDVRISAGGVAAIPILLGKAASLMEGAIADGLDAKALACLARAVSAAAEEEVSPISDVRGSAGYRKRMTGRLVLAHFLRFFGSDGIAKELFP